MITNFLETVNIFLSILDNFLNMVIIVSLQENGDKNAILDTN